jgi:hypothetical protein
MFQMKASTEQNLALAEQAQQIGDALAGRARDLDQALSGFRLAGDGREARDELVAPPTPPAATAAAPAPAPAPAPLPQAPVSPPQTAAEQSAVEFF